MDDRDIELTVEIKKKGRGGKEAAAELGELDGAATKADKSLKKTAKTSEEVTAALGKAETRIQSGTGSMRDFRAELKSVNAEMERSRIRVQELSSAFALGDGDKAVGRALRSEQSRLGMLERIAKSLGKANIGDGAAMKIPIKLDFAGAMGGGGGGGALIGGVVALVAMAAPAIGAMVGGAVLGGVAAGGVVGGVVAATKDPRVKQAWQDMLARFDAADFGGDAMAQPVMNALQKLGTGIKGLGLDEALSQAGPALDELTDGVLRFAQGIMPGFNAVMANSAKIAAVMGDGLATVGESIGDMLATINSSEGALVGLEALFDALGWTIRTVGDVTKFLGDGFKFAATASAFMSGGLEDVFHWLQIITPVAAAVEWAMRGINDTSEEYAGTNDQLAKKIVLMGTATAQLSQGLDPFAAYLKAAANNAHALNIELKDLFAGALAVDEATIKYEESVDKLTGAIKENGKTIDEKTEKGRAVRGAILDEIQAAMALREANIAAGKSTDDANKIYQDQINKLEQAAIKAGINKEALLALTGDYHVNLNYTITTRGSAPRFVGANFSEPARDAMGAGRRATGGQVLAGESYMVGETRPELFTPDQNGRISTTPTGGGGGSAGSARLAVFNFPSGSLEESLMETIRTAVEARGGKLAVLGLRG